VHAAARRPDAVHVSHVMRETPQAHTSCRNVSGLGLALSSRVADMHNAGDEGVILTRRPSYGQHQATYNAPSDESSTETRLIVTIEWANVTTGTSQAKVSGQAAQRTK